MTLTAEDARSTLGRPLPGPGRRMLRPFRSARSAEWTIAAVVTLVVGYLVLSPVVYLVWQALIVGDGLGLGNVAEAYQVPGTGNMLWNSVIFTVGTGVLSTVIGTALAFFCVRTNAPLKPLLYAASVVPLIIPGILFTIAFIYLFSSRAGMVNDLLRSLGLDFLTVDVFSMTGMIIVDALHLSPIVFLLMFAAFRGTDPALEEAAFMSGATVPGTVRRITLPLVRPALLGAFIIMLIRGLGSFETPAVLGIPAGEWVFTSRIYAALSTYPVRYDIAAIYAITLMLLTAVGLLYVQWASRRGERFQTITGKGYRPRPIDLGRWRWPVSIAFGAYFVVVVVAPVLVLVWMSLLPYYQAPSLEALRSLTLDNYAAMGRIADIAASIRNSVILSVASATAVMLLMSLVSWVVLRSGIRGRKFLDSLAGIPLAFPGLVLGVALVFIYLRSPLPIYGTLVILFIAYVTSYLPYGMRYASSSMAQISVELEEAAQMSGSRWLATFRRVTLPLMAPGLVAGWVYVVVVSIRELSSSILLYSPGTEVFAVTIWELWQDGQATVLAAVGVTMVVALMALVGVAYKLGANIGIRD